MSCTLADLVHCRADLALIALPADQVAAALGVSGRIRCRAALVLSSSLPAAPCAALLAIAKRHGVHLPGPGGPTRPVPRGPAGQVLAFSALKLSMPSVISLWAPSGPVQPVTLTHLPGSRSL
jgi:hypothetical protein